MERNNDNNDIDASVKIVERKNNQEKNNAADNEAIRVANKEDLERAKKLSQSNQKIKYNNLKRKIIAIGFAISTIIGASAYTVGRITGYNKGYGDSYHNDIEAKNEVDELIDKYYNLMENYADESTRIQDGPKEDVTGKYVKGYDVDRIVDYLGRAASKSELEARCALISAYKVIFDNCKEEVLEETFRRLAANEKYASTISENCDYLLSGDLKEVLATLGYDNLDDYKMNERQALYVLQDAMNIVEGRSKN